MIASQYQSVDDFLHLKGIDTICLGALRWPIHPANRSCPPDVSRATYSEMTVVKNVSAFEQVVENPEIQSMVKDCLKKKPAE